MSELGVVAVKIPIPAEAVVPILIGIVALLVLIFAGGALATWKDKNPAVATKVGMAIALACTGYAIYTLARVVPETDMNDRIHNGIQNVGFLDGPIAGFLGIIGAILWRYANQRWIALGSGGLIAIALLIKPLVFPLRHWYKDSAHVWGLIDPEHLSFLGPGVAVAIAALVAGLSPPKR